MIVLAYYFCRAVLVIFPDFTDSTPFYMAVEAIQFIIFLCLVAGVVYSFQGQIGVVKHLLFI